MTGSAAPSPGIVVIDSFPESARRYGRGWAVVAVDVIRATTTAITAAAAGRRCFPARSAADAFARARSLENPLLAGEWKALSGPYAFETGNSPTAIARRADIHRPVVLLSSSGTRLICEASTSGAVYLACFRNAAATARHLAKIGYRRIAVLGAGTRDEFREEDQICCAWIARDLLRAGYAAPHPGTVELARRWRRAQPRDCLRSRSVAFLRRTGQLDDLRFILDSHNDLDAAFFMQGGEVARWDQSQMPAIESPAEAEEETPAACVPGAVNATL